MIKYVYYCPNCSSCWGGNGQKTDCPECGSDLVKTDITQDDWHTKTKEEKEKLKQIWRRKIKKIVNEQNQIMKVELFHNFAIHQRTKWCNPESFYMKDWDEDTIVVINGKIIYIDLLHECHDNPSYVLNALEKCVPATILITDFKENFLKSPQSFGGSKAYKIRKNIYGIYPGSYEINGTKILYSSGERCLEKMTNLVNGKYGDLNNIYFVGKIFDKGNIEKYKKLYQRIPSKHCLITDPSEYQYYKEKQVIENIKYAEIDLKTGKPVVFGRYSTESVGKKEALRNG